MHVCNGRRLPPQWCPAEDGGAPLEEGDKEHKKKEKEQEQTKKEKVWLTRLQRLALATTAVPG